MVMKSPTQTTSHIQVQTVMAAVESLTESPALQLPPTAKQRVNDAEMLEPNSSRKNKGMVHATEQAMVHTLRVPSLHKMRSEPQWQPVYTSTHAELATSHSHDDADANEELLEQGFGNISPILQVSRCSISAISDAPAGNARANNLRLKFHKSHTCGSLFANCSCSSPLEASLHVTEREREREHSGINAPRNLSIQLSVSPTSTEHSMSSSSRQTSGIYSQTSSATSAQLSRDESMSASFDYAYSAMPYDGTCRDHSPNTAKLAHTSLADTTACAKATFAKKLQVPRISSPTSDPTISNTPPGARKVDRTKSKQLFQSYSHPDTQYIFTEQNKHPSKETLVQIHAPLAEATVITSRRAKVEIRQPKRSSSLNIGQLQVLDVAVHPDLLVKISPKHSPVPESRRLQSPSLQARSAQQRRRLLQRSHEIESGGSTSESEYSFDVKSPTGPNPADLLKALQRLPQKSPPASPVLATKSVNCAPDDSNFNAAQKYFAESGILGPLNTSTNLIRKTSKILQDSNVIEQIRKTSMILRANNYNSNINNNNGNIKTTTTPPRSPTPTIATPLKNPNNVNMEKTTPIIYEPSSPKSPHTMATTCGFSPNVTTKSCLGTDDRDAQIKSLQGEIVSLKDVIKSRDAEIVKLRREIHKLKSVLQQTTNHLPIANDDLLQSPPAALTNRTLLPLQSTEISSTQQQTCACCKKKLELETGTTAAMATECPTPESVGPINAALSVNYQSGNSLSTYVVAKSPTCALVTEQQTPEKTIMAMEGAAAITVKAANDALGCNGVKSKIFQLTQAPVLKKQGVSGESCETSMQQSINVPIPKFDKDYSSKQLIKEAIMDNDFLKNIDASQVRELVDSMYPLSVAKSEFVIREGEAGAHLYVSAEGEFEVVKNGKVLGIMGPGKAFGELAILYNCTRTASIRVLSDARVWVLDRRVFQQIMMRTGMQRIENSVNFLKSVPLLKNLSVEVLAKIADVLEVEFYPAGTYIIRQGASGDTFFLISQGSVKVTQKLAPSLEEKEIRTLQCGDYFGEQALINEDKRTANIIAMAPGVECLTLDRDSFTHLIGDLCELKEKNYGDENRVLAMKFAEKRKDIFGANVQQEFPDMKLTDLEVIATLGIGGFGRVELVKAYQHNRVDIFALKCLKKRHIVDTKQEEHVFSERTIMLTCNTPFICRLHRTFRDDKYVYMLLEACMGGEIWTMLRDRGSFNENTTQFIIACVLQAFEYLHARGIIYRDLKPENLMLDERGYVKLVDFGFSKYIGNSSKTWTFCGTPEYVAPEIILNKGHDRAVDYWALGILIHELLNGAPPFTANDPMKTYNLILKGIDMIAFPKHMSRSAVQLIKKLCRDVPAERLGYQKSGIQDIKKHKWFLGFDWDGLQTQLLTPPFVRPIAHPTDTCYFDRFPCDANEPPDEISGWDADF